MKKIAWVWGAVIVCAHVAAHAADRADGTTAPPRTRHHRQHKPVRRAEPVQAEDAATADDADPASPAPAGKGPAGGATKAVTPAGPGARPGPAGAPASALPEPPPTDPNGAAVAEPPPAAPAVQPNDTVEAVETVEAEPARGSTWFTDSDPVFDRVFDQYTTQPVRPRTLNSLITHRNREGILVGPFYDLLGFDGGGLKVGLALRYGIIEDLDVGLYRQNGTVEVFDTYELDGRYQMLKQSEAMPVSLGARVGLTWFSASGNNALAGFAEAMVNRRFFNALLVGVNLTYHSNSASPTKRSSDPKWTGGIGVVAEYRILDYLSVGAEVTVGALGYSQKYPAITVGPKFITNRHTFAITISNTQSETTDSIITNTWRSTAKDWLLGFNISREI